jgi:hypothetical protein
VTTLAGLVENPETMTGKMLRRARIVAEPKA